ncbi:hypothetical protein HYFRA_00007810 [Hymenoscyphus fraxineus]|uniref:Uncharacterized protein n=1 Tax=Hymenoscyphus fraxineus TaxID=746836 RepID=A0A9N9KP71_9HELO|nr:hypothetical protein HYFRA_00007810 [Hymenoscyphus fraxineus]
MAPQSDESSVSPLPTTAPSSPPELNDDDEVEFLSKEDQRLHELDKQARIELAKAEAKAAKKRNTALKKKLRQQESDEERRRKEQNLEDLLKKSEAFSNRLTGKTNVLGRVGSSLDGAALGEHDLVMATQPKCMIGGTMRDYQLEGLTWMLEICTQGMSGILADEMGLGKTIQTISLIAHLREAENYLGPHLIVAPLSTLSNWIEEFQKWVPSVPVLLYHGTKPERKKKFEKDMMKHITNGRVTTKFPVVCTSPEMVLMDQADLTKINWEFIIIDEGHRMKNSEAKLFKVLKTFRSATRLLITGTPLQNNLKELWSLLNFILPDIFAYWEQFESWFDFSDLQDEERTQEFIQDKKKAELVRKLHVILRPLLLRRIKADVEHLLPKKREYILYAPMTKDQTELYNAIADKKADTRKFLEDKIVERLVAAKTKAQAAISKSGKKAISKSPPKEEDSSDEDQPLALRVRAPVTAQPKNAFQFMMKNKSASSSRVSSVSAPKKRKQQSSLETPDAKSAKSSRQSTPASSIRGSKSRGRRIYTDAYSSDDDALSDDEFESKLAQEMADREDEKKNARGVKITDEEKEMAEMADIARKEVAGKKLGNPIMQLRLTCNSPHNFYNPWAGDLQVDETLVTSSGKMLLLDRLLKSLFERNHKVLVFSQFKTQIDLLEDYARDLRGWNVCRIDGSVAQDDRRQQIKEFNENPDFKLFLLSTRAGGQGINLASADTVILFDSDWNPQQDLQAQDRAHRIGQKNPVVIFRLATRNTVEEGLLRSAQAKRRLEKAAVKKGGYKDMGNINISKNEGLGMEDFQDLLLKDGMVFQGSGQTTENLLSESDLDMLCDRSDAAYENAAKGLGDTELFKVFETKADGFTDVMGDGAVEDSGESKTE